MNVEIYNPPLPGLVMGPRRILSILRELDAMWGHARIGLCLTDAFVHNVTRTSEEIATNCQLHRDTVRRHLRDLENVGRVMIERQGRSVNYRPDPDWAKKTIAKLVDLAEWATENQQEE